MSYTVINIQRRPCSALYSTICPEHASKGGTAFPVSHLKKLNRGFTK